MCRLKILFFLIILSFSNGFAQKAKKTILAIYTTPPSEGVLINDSILVSGNVALLEPGKHRIRTWAPNYVILDTIIEVTDERSISLIYEYERTKDYLVFETEIKKHTQIRRLRLDLPALVTAGLAGYTIYNYFTARSLYNESSDLYNTYLIENNDLETHFADFESVRDEYKNRMVSFYISSGTALVSSYFFYKGLKWHKANVPDKPKDKNPFLSFKTAYFAPIKVNGINIFSTGIIFTLN